MRTATHNGQICYFDEASHIYTVNGQILTSGTTFVKKFFKPFDAPVVAEKIAPDRGVSPAELMAEWRESGEQGTLVHSYAQWIYSDIDGPPYALEDDNRVGRLTIQLLQACAKLMGKGFEPLEAEKIIFSVRLGLAGMIDLPLKDPDGRVVLLDWKTNKSLTLDNPFETGLPPIDHLEDANLVHYALQLSLYQYILETEGYFPVGQEYRRLIVHLTETDNKVYSCKYLKDDIENMLI